MAHIENPMRTNLVPFVLMMVVLLLAFSSGGSLASEEDKDARIQEAILLQIEAFANNDRDVAWDFASEGVKRRFGTSEVFVSMVRQAYPAVHQATAIEFTQRVPHGEFDIQVVRLQGPEGKRWDAYYRMVKTEGGWKISGVQLQPVESGI